MVATSHVVWAFFCVEWKEEKEWRGEIRPRSMVTTKNGKYSAVTHPALQTPRPFMYDATHLHGSEWCLLEQSALLFASADVLDGHAPPSALANLATLLDVDGVLHNDIVRGEVAVALVSRYFVLQERAGLDAELHPGVGAVVPDVGGEPLLPRGEVVLPRDDEGTGRLRSDEEPGVGKVAILVGNLVGELVQAVGQAVSSPLDGNCLALQLIVRLTALGMESLPGDHLIDGHCGRNERSDNGKDEQSYERTGPLVLGKNCRAWLCATGASRSTPESGTGCAGIVGMLYRGCGY